MSTTSTEVKNRWNAQHYDRTVINLPKGGADDGEGASWRLS